MAGRGESKTSPRRVEAQIRAAKAVRLRADGYSYCEIAKELGYKNGNVAQVIVTRTLAKVRSESVDTMRRLENRRLDEKQEVLAPEIRKANLAAITVDLKVQERRAKLNGLDAPAQIDLGAKRPFDSLLDRWMAGDEAANLGEEAGSVSGRGLQATTGAGEDTS